MVRQGSKNSNVALEIGSNVRNRIRNFHEDKSRFPLVLLILVGFVCICYWQPEADAVSQIPAMVTFVTLALAVYQLWQANTTSRSVKDISEAMSTQYVGVFPYHVPEIIKVLGTARKKVTILCDVLGYGHFSAPRQYELYRAKIIEISEHVEISIAVYDNGYGQSALSEQFGDPFESIRDSLSYANYMSYRKIDSSDQPTSREEFFDMLTRTAENHYKDFNVGSIAIDKVKKGIPVCFWIVDDRIALFSFPSKGISPLDVAFKTSDYSLIQVFKSILAEVTRKQTAAGNPVPR